MKQYYYFFSDKISKREKDFLLKKDLQSIAALHRLKQRLFS